MGKKTLIALITKFTLAILVGHECRKYLVSSMCLVGLFLLFFLKKKKKFSVLQAELVP